jgi:hypothetical protein
MDVCSFLMLCVWQNRFDLLITFAGRMWQPSNHDGVVFILKKKIL